MLNYAICEISGKQYKVTPGKPLEVPLQAENSQDIEAKVLFLSEDGKVKVGNPYLKEALKLQVVDNIQGKKIRVAKFHAKANYRRVKGFRAKVTKVILSV